jgi:hypothetical protein
MNRYERRKVNKGIFAGVVSLAIIGMLSYFVSITLFKVDPSAAFRAPNMKFSLETTIKIVTKGYTCNPDVSFYRVTPKIYHELSNSVLTTTGVNGFMDINPKLVRNPYRSVLQANRYISASELKSIPEKYYRVYYSIESISKSGITLKAKQKYIAGPFIKPGQEAKFEVTFSCLLDDLTVR